MKLRCVTNSIRLRVTKSDLSRLKKQGKISEQLEFGTVNRLIFSLEIDASQAAPNANYKQDELCVLLPSEMAQQWIDSNQVGIEHTAQQASGTDLHLLIEKDFPCIDREDEDKSDTFEALAKENGATC